MGNRVGRQQGEQGQQQVLEVTHTFGKDKDAHVEAEEEDDEDRKPTLEPISEVEERDVPTPDFSRAGIRTPFADPRVQHVATLNVKFVHMN